MIRASLRGHGASILVAALAAAFGVALLDVVAVLGAVIGGNDRASQSATVVIALGAVAYVFVAIAVYVGAIVTANTFAVIIAGRVRAIALLRLVGDTASRQRRIVAREGLAVGLIGAAIGAVAGTVVAAAVTGIATAAGAIPAVDYPWFEASLLVPLVAVVLTTWLASRVGSRRVLTVTPLQAIGGAEERSREEVVARPGRTGVAVALFVIGGALLALGVAVGTQTQYGVLIGLVGGILSFTGIVVGAHLLMPPALRLVGRLAGRAASRGGRADAATRLAAENAVRHPERSARATIGLVIGVTLVTTFAVATQTFANMVLVGTEGDPSRGEVVALLNGVQAVFGVLVGFSALIAAIGLVNTLSLSVLQRRRELGLLRALGFGVRQVRRMILAESAQLTVTAVVLGLVLGTVYGWAGAQSLLGSAAGNALGIVPPGVPWLVVLVIAVGTALLTWVAALVPSRRATRVSAIAALAVE